ncbi:tetraacyldisaccharide 4'-kinase [bacterium]|nr:tetraacyldisaccharide 4'-kinase [bacterium]
MLYGTAAAARAIAFHTGLKKSNAVDCPVISVGNLTTGGTGKTPIVIEIARHYRDMGRRVAVVSRGYRREATAPVLVVSDGHEILAPAREAGDEPSLIARALPGVAVVVGARRYDAARTARDRCKADLIVLDDGFQHRALARDCDLILWDSLRPLESLALLPRGLLRESLAGLRRAHALIFTRSNLATGNRKALARIKRIAPHLIVFESSLEIAGLRPLDSASDPITLVDATAQPAAALCGIGNPTSFWGLLEAAGVRLVWKRAFPDHYRPSRNEIQTALGEAEAAGARRAFITEKDAQNMPENSDYPLPVFVVTARNSFGSDIALFHAFLDRIPNLNLQPADCELTR